MGIWLGAWRLWRPADVWVLPAELPEAVLPRHRHFRYLGRHHGLYLGSVCCHGPPGGVLSPDVVGAGGAVRRAAGVAARVWDRQGHRAEVWQHVPDLDPAGRPWAGRGALGRGAAGRPAASAPVQVDPRGAGRRHSGASGHTCPDPGWGRRARRAPGYGAGGAMGGLTRVLAGLLRR